MTTATGEPRAAVSVEELKRAWHAVQAGRFRRSPATTRPAACQATVWEPPSSERVLPVVGCVGSCGASALALALATASGGRARVIECSSATASGLAGASTAELGPDASGWTRGTRGEVVLERTGDVLAGVGEVPVPSAPPHPVEVSVLDVGWELGQVVAAPSWLGDQVAQAAAVVLVTTATVPGLRRLEAALDLLTGSAVGTGSGAATGTAVLAAVVGPRRRKWAKPVQHAAGPLTRAVDRDGHLVEVPRDPVLAVAGLTPRPLPASLLTCATDLLRLTAAARYEGNPPG